MRPLQALAIYLIAVFLGGALAAPWLYWLVQTYGNAFPHLAESPFHRFVNRSLLVAALIGIWPLTRSLGYRSLKDLGLVNPACHWKKFGVGFALGFVSLAVVALTALATGARVLPDDFRRLAQRLLGAGLTAIIVAVLEELLFRGALFGALRKTFNWLKALVISSIIYALVHFMESARLQGGVQWYSGLELLPRMLRGLADWQALLPGFFNLMLAGALLALAYQRTGNLYFSIGLHAGWIFWLKSYGILTREVPGANAWLWGGGKLISGWVALPVLAGALLLFLRFSPGRQQDISAAPARAPI